jgi:hypothetical protein
VIAATVATLTDLGFLWFREFYLESSRVIQVHLFFFYKYTLYIIMIFFFFFFFLKNCAMIFVSMLVFSIHLI